MKRVPFSEIAESDWDAVCDVSDEAWLFHRHAWISFEAAYAGVENLSFGLEDGDRLVAVAPLFASQLGLGPFIETLIHDGYHRHTGLAIVPALDPGETQAVRTAWIDAIREIGTQKDADRIHLACQNLAPSALSNLRVEIPFWVTEQGFQLGQGYGPAGIVPAPGLSTVVADQIVALEHTEDFLFARLKDTCRRAIRKADKSGAVAEDLTANTDCIETYYRIATLSAARTGEQLPHVDFYRSIYAAQSPRGRCTLLVVRVNSTLAAAAILLHDKGGMYFLSGVSDPAFLDKRVNDFLHWSAIKMARERGFTHYRLGPYFPTVPKGWPIETVSRFKTKFGAEQRTIVQGSLFLRPKRYIALAQAHIAQLCEDIAG